MDVIVDLGYVSTPPQPTPALSPFWHFEEGGCNQSGLWLSLAMPADDAGRENPWGLGGGQANAYLTYAPDFPQPGRGRLRISIVRSFPTVLDADQRYLAFRLVFNTCFAADCDGCGDPGLIYLDHVVLHGANGDIFLDPWTPNDYPLACFNNNVYCGVTAAAGASAETLGLEGPFRPVTASPDDACGPTPTRVSTWGAIKTLYR